jgi:hypothetical protein
MSRTRSTSGTRETRRRLGEEVRIASSGHSAGAPDRCGVVVGFAGEHYRVRWADGRESVLHRDLAAAHRR